MKLQNAGELWLEGLLLQLLAHCLVEPLLSTIWQVPKVEP